MAFKRVLVLIQVGVASLEHTSTRLSTKLKQTKSESVGKARHTFAFCCYIQWLIYS